MAKKKKNKDSLLPTDTTKKQKEGVIETKHGIKALSGFTDEALKKKFKTIPSGSLYLDHAMGGGFKKGTLAEIWGWEQTGKCFSENNYLITKDGLYTVKEFFNLFDQELTRSQKVIDVKAYNKFITNELGKEEHIDYLTFNGVKKCIKITTKKGYFLEVTDNHPIRCMSENGFVVWKKAGDIKFKDYMTLKKGMFLNSYDQYSKPRDKAYITGLLIADGYISKKKIIFTNDNSIILKNFFSFMEKNNVELKQYPNNNRGSIGIHINKENSKNIIFEFTGIAPALSSEKKIPKWIRIDSRDTISFLRAYVDCEGHFCEKGIEITSASEHLSKEVHLLLLGLGVISSLKVKNVKNYQDNKYYRIHITGENYIKYLNIIGTDIKIDHSLNEKMLNDRNSIIPNQKCNIALLIQDYLISSLVRDVLRGKGSLTKLLLTRVLQYYIPKLPCAVSNFIISQYKHIVEHDYFFDEVANIEEVGFLPTFDLSLGDTHTFMLGGAITHNTTLALHTVKEAMSKFPKEDVAYIDFEHALDETYAKSIGVNLDKVSLIQPDHGEQGLDILEDYVRMGNTSVIIIDSVTGIVPKREIETGIKKPGELATILGRKVNILKNLVKKTETLVIFINQIRLQQIKPYPMYGPTGGNSLKFYSNIRMELKKDSTLITLGNDPIGQIVHAHVVKNKFYKPYRKCDFYIIFGEGISLFDEVFDISLENGEIEKAGTWYKINGENIGQGKVNCIQLLKKDKVLFAKLEKRAKEFIFN